MKINTPQDRGLPGDRREFLKIALALSTLPALTVGDISAAGTTRPATPGLPPWYRRTFRWGQTNINERDPLRYDIDWWRQHWKATRTQGLVINAGGIVAYYPSPAPLQYKAEFLQGRDLYGELVRAAHADGLAVLARMDSNRALEDFYRAHPDWFAVDAQGQPYRADERYISCIDGPYYEKYLPSVLQEIIAWEKPEGFTDNSWSGLDRDRICYCPHSRRKFKEATGHDLPERKDWDDPAYLAWIIWSYARRLEIWDLNNRVTRSAGGEDCLWLGMLGGDFVSQGRQFRDIRAICRRSQMVMLDDQGRSVEIGFHENAEIGKRLHELLGWEKIIPESMAMYQRSPTFRKGAASAAEARMWMISGFAGTIQPWWHHVGAYQWDRRQFRTAQPLYEWYEHTQEYLVDRRPIANVGIVYSQKNADFYGRDEANEKVARPYYGIVQALVRARIPYLPVHADDLEARLRDLSLLILPNLGILSESQASQIRSFAAAGGAVLATGETGLFDDWGKPRGNFLLSDLMGIQDLGQRHGSLGGAETWEGRDHSYLRLRPPVGRDVYGPVAGDEPEFGLARHPALHGFEQTDILPFGGLLIEVSASDDCVVPLTLVPSFPAYPPETSWMRVPSTEIPALVLRQAPSGARLAYLAADIDRRYSRDNLPDHGRLLENLIRWNLSDEVPVKVGGPGLIDVHLYGQENRLVLHLVNLTGPGTWRSPAEQVLPVGPITVAIRSDLTTRQGSLRFLVERREARLEETGGWLEFELPLLNEHEVAVIE